MNTEKSKHVDISDPSVIQIIENMQYVTKKKPEAIALMTYWIVADFGTSVGRTLLENGLEYLVMVFTSYLG